MDWKNTAHKLLIDFLCLVTLPPYLCVFLFLSPPQPLTLLVSFDERLSWELRRGFSIAQQRRSADLCEGRTDELFPLMFVKTQKKKRGKKTPAVSWMGMWGLSHSRISLCELLVWYLLFTLEKAGFQNFCMFCSFWTAGKSVRNDSSSLQLGVAVFGLMLTQ